MGDSKHIRIMGYFEQAPYSPKKSNKPKSCGHCGKPVRETTGNSGYCKKCIAEMRKGMRDES